MSVLNRGAGLYFRKPIKPYLKVIGRKQYSLIELNKLQKKWDKIDA